MLKGGKVQNKYWDYCKVKVLIVKVLGLGLNDI